MLRLPDKLAVIFKVDQENKGIVHEWLKRRRLVFQGQRMPEDDDLIRFLSLLIDVLE